MRQFSKARRRLAAGAFLMVAGPVALGSVAYACQSLSTLHANPGTAAAGSQVTLYGKNYGSSAANSNIEIRLDTRDGRIIHEFTPRAVIDNQPITIPADVAVGAHTLLATQRNLSTGTPQSGSPGRTTLTVTPAAGRVASEGSAASAAAATSSSPVAATPVAATPAAPAAVTAPAASSAAASVASAPAAAAPVAAQAPAAAAAAPAAAVADSAAAASVVATPAGPAGPAAPDAAQVTVGGLLPASSSSSSVLPGLTLGAGLALVLLSLGAFLKSSRNVRSDTPLAG